jgi:hypothetical protein
LLGSVHLTGRFPFSFDALPASLLAHVCKQLKLAGLLFLAYPNHPATLHEHKERLKTYIDLRSFVPEEHPALVLDFVREQVRELATSTEDASQEQPCSGFRARASARG